MEKVRRSYSTIVPFRPFYRPQLKLREGNVFTPVLAFCPQGGCVSQNALRQEVW